MAVTMVAWLAGMKVVQMVSWTVVRMAVSKDEMRAVQMAPWMVARMAVSKDARKVAQMVAKTVEWDLKKADLTAQRKVVHLVS